MRRLLAVVPAVCLAAAAAAWASPAAAPPFPKAGTYTYATTGSESVDVFSGEEHTYPSRTTMVVKRGGCGGVLTWSTTSSRSTRWEVCRRGGGWQLALSADTHRFLHQKNTTAYRCTPPSWLLPPRRVVGVRWTISCSTGGTTEAGQGVVAGRPLLRVGRARLRTVHVRLTATLTGDTKGDSTYEWWIVPTTGLVVRHRETSRSTTHPNILVGDVHFAETLDLRLLSLRRR